MKGRTAILATLEHQLGYPYAAVTETLPLEDGDVVIFVSNLAEHTIHLKRDPRAALLYSDGLGLENPLAHARLSLMGRFTLDENRALYRDAYLERFPHAAQYIDFNDFNYFRFRAERVRFIGGFGRMGWLEGDAYRAAAPDVLWRDAPGILAHMNQDHAHNLLDYARVYGNTDWAESSVMRGIDRYGFDLEVRGTDRLERVRIGFDTPLQTTEDAHQTLVKMAREARSRLASSEVTR